MKLFEVTRWGNEVDGGNGPDTNYLVCAHDHEEAAALVRGDLQLHCEQKTIHDTDDELFLDAITELGTCLGTVQSPVIFRGPYIQHKLECGTYFTLWSWDSNLNVWIPTARCRDGEATCHYVNGQLAARCRWKDGREHGKSESWYANGQLLYCYEHRNGRMVGIHEYWYDDGKLAMRFEYTGNGVRYQSWDRAGLLVKQGNED
jgi:hypothetical protein